MCIRDSISTEQEDRPLSRNASISRIAAALELYVNGSLNIFNHRTNVCLLYTSTRHISIEIHFNLKPIPEVEQVTA